MVQLSSPMGLLALGLPIAYLLFARHLVHIERRLVGSLALWRRVAEVESQATQGGRITWRTVLFFLGLTAIALTAAGPVFKVPHEARTWSLVLGTGPAGELPSPRPGGELGTRLDEAVALGFEFSKANGGDRFRWIGSGERVFEAGSGDVPPAEFLQEIAGAARREWGAWDRADCLWLPVSGFGPEPRAAGIFRNQLAASSGIVGRTEEGTWAWDEDTGLELVASAERPAVWVSGAALAEGEPVRRFVNAWAAAWDVDVVTEAAPAVLRISSPSSRDAAATVRVGRDGWLANATPAALAKKRGLGLIPFLRTDGVTYAGSAPGRIELAFVHLDEPEGDPAAFAVSWAALFEETALAAPGIVGVVDRRAAAALEKQPQGASESPDSNAWPLGAPLAVLGGLLLVLGLRR